MDSVIITGATSFIGTYLIQRLLKENCEIYAVIRPGSPNRDRLPKVGKIKIIELELADIRLLPDLLQNGSVDAFYHLAWDGIRGAQRCDNERQKKNYQATLAAVEAAVELGCKSFVGSGSQAEYGIYKGKLDEQVPCKPLTEYGHAKYKAYVAARKIAEANHLRFVWARIFSVYGAYDHPGTLIMSCIHKMREGLDVDLTECSQMWDFIYAEDVAEALLRLGESKTVHGVYNIAYGHPEPLRSFVECLKEIMKSDSKLNFGIVPYGKDGAVSIEPVIEKLKSDIDWEPQITFEEGIKRIIACEGLDEKDKYFDTNIQ